MKRLRKLWCLTALLATAFFFLGGINQTRVSATNTPQAIPFSQNWTNTGLITANDDWSGVPGIVGFLGDFDAGSVTGVDPRTLLTPFAINNIDVIANQTSVAITNGGVAEFDGIANPVVALNGSGTADAPHIIVYLNTTGLSNVQFSCNIRDIDDTTDNAIQPVDVQYRVGGSGNYTSVPGGFIADASSGPSTTMSTALNLSLPAAVNNQSQVEVRIMTTNAVGNDEWIGIDDINVTATPATPTRASADFNGDGKTDFAVTRVTSSPGLGLTQKWWYINYNGTTTNLVQAWGLSGDIEVPEDFDGDGKDDLAVWRAPGVVDGQATFYILQSGTNTARIDSFGLSQDDVRVVGDYDGDGKADPATFRCPTASTGQCTFYYRGSLNNPNGNITFTPWGSGTFAGTPTVLPYAGDFDGDGKFDFCIRRDGGGGSGQFVLKRSSDAGIEYINWGLITDNMIPGDFDGDGKMDFALARLAGSTASWYILERDGGGTGASPIVFGNPTTDSGAWGDYDGDGKQDIAVWRPNADPTQNFYLIRQSSTGALMVKEWGQQGDQPVQEWNGH